MIHLQAHQADTWNIDENFLNKGSHLGFLDFEINQRSQSIQIRRIDNPISKASNEMIDSSNEVVQILTCPHIQQVEQQSPLKEFSKNNRQEQQLKHNHKDGLQDKLQIEDFSDNNSEIGNYSTNKKVSNFNIPMDQLEQTGTPKFKKQNTNTPKHKPKEEYEDSQYSFNNRKPQKEEKKKKIFDFEDLVPSNKIIYYAYLSQNDELKQSKENTNQNKPTVYPNYTKSTNFNPINNIINREIDTCF
ncbi:UNKNOWN [Stylonychia lemnae]|uniref:Uncharacterized protein n=1 Tax=Stylonychia lemnae TaxID=5949 RepID=A0A078AL23_STYLE|nr:UNKNOWN [Stylonychia lemnae]|eukprot:CDW82581.1 UNKNOWN [Stylonychia lemnae]